jgi:hypothetical protein
VSVFFFLCTCVFIASKLYSSFKQQQTVWQFSVFCLYFSPFFFVVSFRSFHFLLLPTPPQTYFHGSLLLYNITRKNVHTKMWWCGNWKRDGNMRLVNIIARLYIFNEIKKKKTSSASQKERGKTSNRFESECAIAVILILQEKKTKCRILITKIPKRRKTFTKIYKTLISFFLPNFSFVLFTLMLLLLLLFLLFH